MATTWTRRRRHAAPMVGLLTLALILVACGSGRSIESEALIPRPPGDLEGTRWILVATHDVDPVPAAAAFTLNIGDGVASGAGPCNRYHLTFTHDGSDVDTGPVAATKVACAAPLASLERVFFRDLERVDTAQKEGTENQLVLSGPDDLRLVFDRADEPASELAGTWNVRNFVAGGALAAPVRDTKPTFAFDSGGPLTVHTGCNTAHTTWEPDGSSVTIAAARSTLKACPSPAGLNEQEANILTALPRVATAEVAHDEAVLSAADETMLFVLERTS